MAGTGSSSASSRKPDSCREPDSVRHGDPCVLDFPDLAGKSVMTVISSMAHIPFLLILWFHSTLWNSSSPSQQTTDATTTNSVPVAVISAVVLILTFQSSRQKWLSWSIVARQLSGSSGRSGKSGPKCHPFRFRSHQGECGRRDQTPRHQGKSVRYARQLSGRYGASVPSTPCVCW